MGPDHPHIQRVVCGQQGQSHHRGNYWNPGPCSEGLKFQQGVGEKHTTSGADHRPLGRGNGVDHMSNLFVVAPDAGVIAPNVNLLWKYRIKYHLLLNINGDVNQYRSRAASGGDVEGLTDDPGQLCRVLDQIAVLGESGGSAGVSTSWKISRPSRWEGT